MGKNQQSVRDLAVDSPGLGGRISVALAQRRMKPTALARAIGVSPATVSVVINSDRVTRTVAGRIAETLEVSLAELVPEMGGSGQPARKDNSPPPRELRAMALRFEAEAVEQGADDEDMDHIREVLRSAAESTLGARGYQDLGPAHARAEMELHIAMLREWLKGRIEIRKRSGRRG